MIRKQAETKSNAQRTKFKFFNARSLRKEK